MPAETKSENNSPKISAPRPSISSSMFVAIAVLVVVVGVLVYRFQFMPQATLNSVRSHFTNAKSYQVNLTVPNSPVTAQFNIQKTPGALSKILVKIPTTESGPADLTLQAEVNKDDGYFTVSYANAAVLLKALTQEYPPIADTTTFKSISAIVNDGQWLHLPWSKLDSVTKQSLASSKTISKEDAKKLQATLNDSVVLKSLDTNYPYNGTKAKRLTVGFDKAKLLQAVDIIKNSNLDVKLSDINNLRTTIQNNNDWNKELVEIIADKDNYPLQVTVSVPSSLNDEVKKQVQNSTSTTPTPGAGKTNVPELGNLQGMVMGPLMNLLPGKSNNGIQKVMTLTFSQYNQDQHVTKPEKIIEYSNIESSLTKDLPVFLLVLAGQSGALPQPTAVPVRYVQPTPVPGAYGSAEWQQEVIKKWHDLGYPDPKDEAEFNFYAPQFCQHYPELCTR